MFFSDIFSNNATQIYLLLHSDLFNNYLFEALKALKRCGQTFLEKFSFRITSPQFLAFRVVCFVFNITMKDDDKLCNFSASPGKNYLIKINNRSTTKKCEICPKLTIKIPERRQ